MVEYGLYIHFIRKICKWVKGLFKSLPENAHKNDRNETTDKNARKASDEEQSKTETKVPIDQLKLMDGSKKHQARHRKWFLKREIFKSDEEKGTESGKMTS
jgi:hypothetical protein